jgi:hypothetical protein
MLRTTALNTRPGARTTAGTASNSRVVGTNAVVVVATRRQSQSRRSVHVDDGKPLKPSVPVGRRSVVTGDAPRRGGGDCAREILLDRGGSGTGGGRGGGRGGGDDGGRGEGDDEDDTNANRGWMFAFGVGASVLATTLASAPEAKAGALNATTRRRSSSKLTDAATSLLYGFVIFYGVKLALKRLFAPVLLFVSTTHLLYKMRTLRVSPFMLYEDLIKPYMPLEYQKNLEDFSAKAMKSKVVDKKLLHDGWWDRQERRFWACAHRLLPACDSPIGERAFVIGILLAGLA